MSTESEAMTSEHRRLSPLTIAILLLVLVGLIAYTCVGLAYASSVAYQTPGGSWLESLINLGIRTFAWPILLATHQ